MPAARRRLTASGAGLGCVPAVCWVTAATAAFGGESVSVVIKAVPFRVRDEDTDCLTWMCRWGEEVASPDGRFPCFWNICFLFCVCCVWDPVQGSVSIMTAANPSTQGLPFRSQPVEARHPLAGRSGARGHTPREACPAPSPPCLAVVSTVVTCLLLVRRVCRRGSGEASP